MKTGLQKVSEENSPLEIIKKFESKFDDDVKVKVLSLDNKPLGAYLISSAPTSTTQTLIFTVLKKTRPLSPRLAKIWSEIKGSPYNESKEEERDTVAAITLQIICSVALIAPKEAEGYNEPRLDHTIIEIVTNQTDEDIPLGCSSIHQLKLRMSSRGVLHIISREDITSSFD